MADMVVIYVNSAINLVLYLPPYRRFRLGQRERLYVLISLNFKSRGNYVPALIELIYQKFEHDLSSKKLKTLNNRLFLNI